MAEKMFDQAVESIADLTNGGQIQFGGGGRGQWAAVIANLPDGDHEFIGRGTSRYAAVVDLLTQVRAAVLPVDRGSVVPATVTQTDRPTVEDALVVIRSVFPNADILAEEKDIIDRVPGPVWSDDPVNPYLLRFIPCVGECMSGQSDICECRCDGANHGIAGSPFVEMFRQGVNAIAALASVKPTMLGEKQCACGCGGITQRKYVPGHDARHHAEQKRTQRIAQYGSIEEFERQRRAARKAAKA